MPRVTVSFKDEKRVINTERGKILLELLRENGIGLIAPCGGEGSCGKCRVKVTGSASELPVPLTETERRHLSSKEIDTGIRLACKTRVINDLEIELIPESIIDGNDGGILTAGSLNQIILESETTEVHHNNYGLVIDLGTTTIVIYLLSLFTGEEIDLEAMVNPQHIYGADVISRINYTLKEREGRSRLKNILVTALNQGIDRLVERNKLQKNDILSTSIAGNTVMLHLLRGINTETMARAPYKPVFTDAQELSPGEIGMEMNSTGKVYLLPSISSFVGADIIADLLVTNFKDAGWRLLLDIGTNGEIILGNQHKVLACSTAAGPAFEGSNISCGMAGIKGAISHYRFDREGHREYTTIGKGDPRGICGSGLVDIIAELLKKGMIDKTGALTGKQKSFLVLPAKETASGQDILLTQKDIREFQLAVGAIRAGISILMKEASITFDGIEVVYLAGGFGNFIDTESACLTGIIPLQLKDKVIKIGNGAGSGAKLYLLNQEARKRAEMIKKKAVYIELSGRNDFQEEFIKSLEFPPLSNCL